MSGGLSLFDFANAHARASDPVTSHEAAAQALPVAKRHVSIIAAYLKKIYPACATADEVAKATKLQRHAVLKRLPELQRDGSARPTGKTRMMSSGRMGRTWEAVP
jgi:predicted ArsR family transcriptional regulator